MKLLLTSEGTHPKTLEKLNDYITGFSKKRILYIPTAANGYKMGDWKTWLSQEVLPTLGADIEYLELENYKDLDLESKVLESDIVWIGGGLGGYLLYWIRRSNFDLYLESFFKKGGVYIGSSSGSMICSKTSIAGEYYIGDEERGCRFIPGLGYIDFEIYPHFTKEKEPEIKEMWEKYGKGKLALLKDGDIILKENDKVSFLGEEYFLDN